MRIGVTGGIGSGKSYICDIFEKRYDIPVLNSDNIVKQEIMHYREVKDQVIRAFGPDSFIDGNINIPKFNKLLFGNLANLQKMNGIILPQLIKYFMNFSSKYKNTIIESAVIFNTDLYDVIDMCILVEVPIDIRMKRLKARYNNDIDLIMSKIDAQHFNRDMADYILKNDSTLDEQIEKLVKKINI